MGKKGFNISQTFDVEGQILVISGQLFIIYL